MFGVWDEEDSSTCSSRGEISPTYGLPLVIRGGFYTVAESRAIYYPALVMMHKAPITPIGSVGRISLTEKKIKSGSATNRLNGAKL